VSYLLLLMASETCRAIPRLGSGGSPQGLSETFEFLGKV